MSRHGPPVSVVETPEFLAATRKLLDEEERAWLIDHLAHHPEAGVVIPGTGGVRQVSEIAMSRNLAKSIRQGLEQAIAFADGTSDRRSYRVYTPVEIDVKAIRGRLGMTQQAFADCFGFSINTLRHWEQGTRIPEGPTRAYLMVIGRAPDAVRRALHSD